MASGGETTPTQRFRSIAADVPVERRLRDLEILLSITRAMSARTELGELIPLLARECTKILRMERSSVWIAEPETGDLVTRVAEGSDVLRVKRGVGIVGTVAETGDMVVIPDAYQDGRFNSDFDKRTGFRTREILCVPLYGLEERRVIGVLQALNKTDGETIIPYDVELAMMIAAQTGAALEQAALREMAAERKRLRAEMDLAHNIQQRLLPRESPVLEGLDISGVNLPATETSGDYFDYVSLPDGRFGVIVADVTGHGLGAALIMTSARGFLRALCLSETDPGKIAARGNDLLERDLENGNFLSLCLAIFSSDGRTLHYASAGHEPPLICRPGETEFATLDSTGPLLGVLPGMEFGVGGPLPLQSGDVILFMTDGLFECMNANNETLGIERVKAVLRAQEASSSQEILKALLRATEEWAAGEPRRDDITAVVVKVK
jgi:phosphoserine phosphatase RsbU/P